jgi:hypothetical protein
VKKLIREITFSTRGVSVSLANGGVFGINCQTLDMTVDEGEGGLNSAALPHDSVMRFEVRDEEECHCAAVEGPTLGAHLYVVYRDTTGGEQGMDMGLFPFRDTLLLLCEVFNKLKPVTTVPSTPAE